MVINFDCITLKAFFEENIDFIIGARVQKIQQPTRRDFIFSMRNNGESRKLYINISPQTYHICFMSGVNEEKRGLKIPKHPPMFCMLLRKYLEGCKVSDAVVIENERIIEFHFETMDELSQERSLCLCVELMGKHSNIILYDRKTSIIIGCAHNVGAEKSRYRELQGGLKYIYPPTTPCPPLAGGPKSLISRRGKEGKCGKSQTEEQLSNLEAVNELIDNYFTEIQEEVNIKNERARLSAIVLPKLKKVKNSVSKIESLLKKRDNTEKYKLYGELLTANLYQKCDYQSQIEVFDYINNRNITIELDSTKTLNENAQRYFKLYSKSKTTKEKSEEMLNNLEIEKAYLENILYSIEEAKSMTDFEEISSELEPEKVKPKKPDEAALMKIKIKDFDVYVGRNNKQNDYIVSKLAKDNDYWFHTRLCAGSHVLLKVQNTEPDEEVLFECCKLAREYSSATQPSKVGVIYTRAKNLRKPPAAPLGYVTYKNEKEVLV